MTRTIIVGAGGHGQVVADMLLRTGPRPDGFYDAAAGEIGPRVLDLLVFDELPADAHNVIVAIGDNAQRMKLFKSLAIPRRNIIRAIHPSAIVGYDVTYGAGCVFCAGVIVGIGSRIGVDVILNTGCSIDHHCTIGDHAHIAPGAHLAGNVTVGEGTLVGIGAAVLPGVTLGAWCTVGAGAVVLADIPDGITVVGVPAIPLRQDDVSTSSSKVSRRKART